MRTQKRTKMNRCIYMCAMLYSNYTNQCRLNRCYPVSYFFFIWLTRLLGVLVYLYINKLINHGYYTQQHGKALRSVWVLYTAPLHC